MDLGGEYLKELRLRKKTSRAYTKHQLLGLEIAQMLGDEEHKSLYIKLAKELNAVELRRLAAEIAERKDVARKGAYFMKILQLKKNVSDRKNKH